LISNHEETFRLTLTT